MGTWERSVEIAAELNGKKALKAAGMHDEYLSIVRDDVCEAEGWYDWVCFDINDTFEAQTFVNDGGLYAKRLGQKVDELARATTHPRPMRIIDKRHSRYVIHKGYTYGNYNVPDACGLKLMWKLDYVEDYPDLVMEYYP